MIAQIVQFHEEHMDERVWENLLQPRALPKLAWADALVLAGLVVYPAGHRPTVDGIVDLVLGEEPHFVTPLFRVAICILGVIVIDQVCVPDVPVEGRVERRVRQKLGQGHCDNSVGSTAFQSVLFAKRWILCSVFCVG